MHPLGSMTRIICLLFSLKVQTREYQIFISCTEKQVFSRSLSSKVFIRLKFAEIRRNTNL